MVDLPFVPLDILLAGGLHLLVLIFQVLQPFLELINVFGFASQTLVLRSNLLMEMHIFCGHLTKASDKRVNLYVLLSKLLSEHLKLITALIQVLNLTVFFLDCLILLLEQEIQFVFFVLLLLDYVILLKYPFLKFFNLLVKLSLA